ncbi:methyltransferase domain-containing protein [Camelimonas abortus]|uniref:Methyltransferase domain-containing protein n=1 Tax=Camelimonas abortus TaxID=1017184 RepID=A0ABV7LFX3_9HYPH
MLNPDADYDNSFEIDNVYGHTLELLVRHIGRAAEHDRAAVHIDLGCGYGRIAEHLTAALGVHYIGIDGDAKSVDALRARGLEAHQLLFGDKERTLEELDRILAGRQVRSLTMLDTLEHLPEGDTVLQVIREIISRDNAPAIISVPNVAHRDIGFRLALGQWDYTRAGLLDHTHTRLFTRKSFVRTLNAAGLHVIDSNDVRLSRSDQHFPDTLPSLAAGTTLHRLLGQLRNGVDDTADVNQFVVMVLAGPASGLKPYLEDDELDTKRPFLSVVTRTQGLRLYCLVEVLTALASQTDRDFEVIIVGHKLSLERQKAVERVIEDCPEWLRSAIRFVREYEGNRTVPLNRGFAEARGEYIVILDDDDLPFAHWVETFRQLAEKAPGAILRAVTARQSAVGVEICGAKGVRAVSAFSPYPSRFDMLAHIVSNNSPNTTLAFPRGVFHDLKLRFDETLTTTEDWDFLMRAAFVVGVVSCDEITAVYRWWEGNHQSSRTDHDEAEWRRNHEAILGKFNQLPIILPPGSASQIRRLLESPPPPAPYAPVPVAEAKDPRRDALYRQCLSILASTCWKTTAPLRWASRRLGRPAPIAIHDLDGMNADQLEAVLRELRRSASWKITRFIHRDSGT